jgi:o-succinylbenzoate synthase
MLQASFEKYDLVFKQASGTSRGVLNKKTTYIITLKDGNFIAKGEAALFKGLSCDDVFNYEEILSHVCENIQDYFENYLISLRAFPSIVFGLEQVFLQWKNNSEFCFENDFSEGKKGIPINGLIWMGSETFMQTQINDKLQEGFSCLKMKIGAIEFDKEFAILENVRKTYPPDILEIRVDANGAFSTTEAPEKLSRLASLSLHSIEQPIKAGQVAAMKQLCLNTPLAIALDEELIGCNNYDEKKELLEKIQPQYIILKPALVGGFSACDEWITLAESMGVSWWITSALESNIGLDAIAQYTFSKNNPMFQGLGTGKLFTNNFSSPLQIINAQLWRK